MLLTIDILLVLINFLFAYLKKTPKIIILINFIFCFVIISGYYKGVDIDNYIYSYKLSRSTGVGLFKSSLIYSFVESLFATHNYSFIVFKQFLAILSLIVLFLGINHLTHNACLVFSAYFLYQIALDTIQFRNYLGMCVIIYSIHFLFEEGKLAKFKYIFCVLLAAGFHPIMIIYLVFLIKDSKYMVRIIAILGVILGILTVLNGMHVPFINSITKVLSVFVKDLEISNYAEKSIASGVSFLLPISAVLFYWMVYTYIYEHSVNKEYYNTFKKIVFVSFVFIPLFFMSFQWYRILRNLLIVFSCGIASTSKKTELSNIAFRHNRVFIVVGFFALTVFWMYSDWFRFVTWDKLKTIFENNYYILKNHI